MANFDVNDIPPEVMKELTKCDCKAQLKALLDRVEREVVGEDEKEDKDCPQEKMGCVCSYHTKNSLKSQQRTALKEIRKSI